MYVFNNILYILYTRHTNNIHKVFCTFPLKQKKWYLLFLKNTFVWFGHRVFRCACRISDIGVLEALQLGWVQVAEDKKSTSFKN